MRAFMTAVAIITCMKCVAATHYVVPPGTAGASPADPYTNWGTAGTNIIDVVNAAMSNSTARLVWVTNGTYWLTNTISITNLLTLQSVNGQDMTILTQDKTFDSNRCISMSPLAAGSVFDGFTVSNFCVTNGSGIAYASTADVRVQNCLFIDNSNKYTVSGTGGGTLFIRYSGTITNCIFKNNWVTQYGGGIYSGTLSYLTIAGCRFEGNKAISYYGGACWLQGTNIVVSNCAFISNQTSSRGGGLYIGGSTNNRVLNCSFTSNTLVYGGGGTEKKGQGGGIYFACGPDSIIKNCSIIGNVTPNVGGGVYGTNITIRNCLIARNQSTTNIGGGIWMTNGNVESCTIVSNYAKVAGGGVYIDGPDSIGTNNIIYFNTASAAANFTNTAGNTGLNYCCVFPAVDGTGNITNNPLLKNLAGGDYRLRMTSPCVNTGTNQPWMTNALDLDGNARILKAIVDMGAYETRLWQGTIFKIP